MNRAAALSLAVVALALFGYILVFERDSLSAAELQKRRGKLLESFVRERVSALEIQRKGVTLRLERQAADDGWEPWKVSKPWQDDADTDAINALLGELEWLDARRRLEDVTDADLESFGLARPRLRLWYEAGDTRTLVEVGNYDVHHEGVYLRIDGRRDVEVVPKTLDEQLNHPLNYFRTKQFLGDVTVAWARSIDIGDGERTWPLRLDGETWWFEAEPRGYADPRGIEKWLRSFDDLRAERYAPDAQTDALRKALRDSPWRSALVKVVPDAGREDKQVRVYDLRVGEPCAEHEDERYVAVGEFGPVVCVREAELAPLFEAPEFLRLRGLFPFGVSEIEKFSLETGPSMITLEREGENWVRQPVKPGAAPVPRLAVETWLADLGQRTALEVRPSRGTSPAVSVLTLVQAGGDDWRIELAAPEVDGSVVRRDEEPLSMRFDALTADLLTYWDGRFRDLRLWEVKPSEVVALQVRGQANTEANTEAHTEAGARSLSLSDDGWHEAGQDDLAADNERVREIVRDLSKLEATRVRAPKPLPAHGLVKPSLELTAERRAPGSDEPAPLRLRVGAPDGSGGAFAQVGDGEVLELPASAVAMLRELLQGPAATDEAAAPGPAEPPN